MAKGDKKRRRALEEINSFLGGLFLDKSTATIELATGRHTDGCEWGDVFLQGFNVINRVKPTRIIFHDPATICFFPDGEKIIAKCSDGEKFIPEYGVMACIIKKIYGGNRSEFLRAVDGAEYSWVGGKDDGNS